MVSKFVRRSGISVCLIADLLEWVPDWVFQVGVGCNPEETAVFKDAWPECNLVGYEAHPEVYKAAKGHYPGTLHQLGISDHAGAATIWTPPRHKDGSSIHQPDAMEARPYPIQLDTLDRLYPNGPDPGEVLLWLDCEGSELAAMFGGAQFMQRVSVINVEVTAKPISKQWCSSNDVHDHLISLGFKRQWVHTQRTSAGQCDAIYVRPHLFRPEFCCCPCMIE